MGRRLRVRVFWRTAFRIAWRSSKSSKSQWTLTVATIALSLASLHGVRGATAAISRAVGAGSREWLAADLSFSLERSLEPAEIGLLDSLRARGNSWTLVTTSLSTAASGESADPGFITVKAVDPARYPFYGRIGLEPNQPLSRALTPGSAVVSEEVLSRLNVRPGDMVRIGASSFRIAASIRAEPDRLAGIPAAGMRCILSREGYARSGIARGGSFEMNRILLSASSEAALPALEKQIEEWFPEAEVASYRDTNPQMLWVLSTAASLLDIPPLMALAIGCFGIAISVREHLERHLDTAAIMKMLGGTTPMIGAIFGIQVFSMLVAGILIGFPIGAAAKSSVLGFANQFLPIAPASLTLREIWEAVGTAVVAVIPAVIAPLRILSQFHPAVILRRNTDERLPDRGSAGPNLKMAASAAVICLLTVAIFRHTWNSTLFLLAALGGSIAATWIGATFFIRCAARASALPQLAHQVRYALRNLGRPANRSRVLIVVLGAGLSTTIGTFETHRTVAKEIVRSIPFDRSNLMVASVVGSKANDLGAVMRSVRGLEGTPQILNLAWLRLTAVDRTPVRELQARTPFLPGRWIANCGGEFAGSGAILSANAAKLLNARAGTRLQFAGRDTTLDVTVTAIRDVDPMQEIWRGLTVSCQVLDGQRVFHHAAVRVRNDQMAAAARDLRERYPTLAVMTAADVASTVSGLAAEIERMVRLLGWYTLAAGLSVLIATIVSTRAGRRGEIATLSLIGARRRWIAAAFIIEFAAIGLSAGITGGLLTGAFESTLLSVVFRRASVVFEVWIVVWLGLTAALATALCGWLALRPAWNDSPMDLLRGRRARR